MPDLVPNTVEFDRGTIFDDITGSRLLAFIIAKLRKLGVLPIADTTLTGATGTASALTQTIDVSQSGTAGFTAWLLNVALTAVGSGAKLLMDLRVAAVSMFSVSSTGVITAASDIASTGGNLLVNTIGKGLQIKTGANARIGNATLVAGTVVVANTSVTANTRILLSRATTGGTAGTLSYTKINSTSFTITSSSGTETSTVDWMLVESIP